MDANITHGIFEGFSLCDLCEFTSCMLLYHKKYFAKVRRRLMIQNHLIAPYWGMTKDSSCVVILSVQQFVTSRELAPKLTATASVAHWRWSRDPGSRDQFPTSGLGVACFATGPCCVLKCISFWHSTLSYFKKHLSVYNECKCQILSRINVWRPSLLPTQASPSKVNFFLGPQRENERHFCQNPKVPPTLHARKTSFTPRIPRYHLYRRAFNINI